MSENLLDLSGKIDEATVNLLDAVTAVCGRRQTPFFLIGATARDLVLQHGHGQRSGRATEDIDLAVEVSGWEEFDRLTEELIETGEFKSDRQPQRLVYRDSLLIDIIPFGEIGGPTKEIYWPPEREVRMQVLGFEETCEAALPVRLRRDPPLDIRVVSPAGLAVLKLIAWADRSAASPRQKDAMDLSFLLSSYLDLGNVERLYDEHSDLANDEDSGYERAGARLLGRDAGGIVSPETKVALLAILERETAEEGQNRLATDMVSGSGSPPYEGGLDLLKGFKQGIIDSNMRSSGKAGRQKGGKGTKRLP